MKESGTYKIVIPEKVENKIKFICSSVWNTEWSGVLFFTYEGTFEDNDLSIICQDIYVMDIGTSTTTEFEMSPEVASYMCEHPELLDCQIGLIHSHNNMATFFSSTDINTLLEEGKDKNNFVSLIVNNKGDYTAAITRKVHHVKTQETISYEFFETGNKYYTTEKSEDNEEIEGFYLKIEKEGESMKFPEIAERLSEIEKNKVATNEKSYTPNPPIDTSMNKDHVKSTFDDEYVDFKYLRTLHFNPVTIKSLVLQLLTGSILIQDNERINLSKWANSLPEIYKKRFGEGGDGMYNFKMWADTFAEYITWYVYDEKLDKLHLSDEEMCSICSRDMVEELKKLPSNVYIEYYISILENYILD